MIRRLFAVSSIALFLIACPGEDPVDNDEPAPDAGPVDDVDETDDVEDDAGDTGDAGIDDPDEYPLSTCDDLDPDVCAYPWPSNLYLEPDDERATGYQLTFGDESLPANAADDVHISPDLFGHLDGYDLGVPIMAQFPNLDDSDLPDEYEIEASMDADASILLYEVDGDTIERIPYWAELDVLEDDAADQTLFIRPAVILEDDTRYIVALRALEDTDGDAIEPSESFSRLVDGDTGDDDVLRHRQQRFDDIFDLLDTDDIDADELTLAWDFHTASSDALHGPMLDIREDALDVAATDSIEWSTESMTRYTDEEPSDDNGENGENDDNGENGEPDLDYDPYIGLEIEATMEVPHYMEPYDQLDDAWKLHRNDDGDIEQNGTREVPVYARIPHSALDGDETGVVVYGHGLLGSRYQIGATTWDRAAEEMGVAFVAVDLVGMSHHEAGAAQETVFDINHFVALSDRLHQGLAEYLLLAHTAADELPGLEVPDGVDDYDIDIDPDDTHYAGASQGGIFGGTFMALTPDVERGYLAVPGNNYSTLLHRSTNFDELNEGMALAYHETSERNLNVAAMSLLWSTTEPVSFLRHVRSEPFGDDDPRDVFLAVAKGDYQVATITNENAARSDIDIPLLENYDEDREPFDADVASYPHAGSGTVLFDFGNPWPDAGNTPPDDDIGDPHGWLATVDDHFGQIETFFRDGDIIDICDDAPCQFDAPE